MRGFEGLEHDPEKHALGLRPDGVDTGFPSRQTRNAFARRSCSNKKIERDDDSKKSHPALRPYLPSVASTNAASIALRVLMVSLPASNSTSAQPTTAPCATLFFSVRRCASPIGSAPAFR